MRIHWVEDHPARWLAIRVDGDRPERVGEVQLFGQRWLVRPDFDGYRRETYATCEEAQRALEAAVEAPPPAHPGDFGV